MATKLCPSCKQEKSLSEFYKKYRGHQRDCVDCRRAYNRKYYLRHRRRPLTVLRNLLAEIEEYTDPTTAYEFAIHAIRERIKEWEAKLGTSNSTGI